MPFQRSMPVAPSGTMSIPVVQCRTVYHQAQSFMRPGATSVSCARRHPAHRAKIVAAYVQSRKGQLELHFLPGYAPDLNPDEFVWNHLRQSGITKKPLKQNEQLKARVEKDLAKIKRSPRLVRSFFWQRV